MVLEKSAAAAAGGIVDARGVRQEHTDASGGIALARGVGEERPEASGGIALTRDVTLERSGAEGGIAAVRGVVDECVRAACCIALDVARRGIRWPCGVAWESSHEQTEEDTEESTHKRPPYYEGGVMDFHSCRQRKSPCAQRSQLQD